MLHIHGGGFISQVKLKSLQTRSMISIISRGLYKKNSTLYVDWVDLEQGQAQLVHACLDYTLMDYSLLDYRRLDYKAIWTTKPFAAQF